MDESTLKRHERLQGLQRANVDAWRGLAPALDATGLDANIKKHTGFIKRCRANMGPDGAAQLLREVKLLKLEKYVSEIVPAVLEGLQKCKTSSEFSAAIDVLSALHARFPIQFTVPLVCQALKQLPPPIIATLAAMPPEQRERDEQARLSRQRPVLRAVSEMYLAGLLWGLDAQPGGAGGVDLAAALTLSRSGPSGGASANGKHSAKAKEVVQQPGHCVLVGVLQNLLLGDREHHLSIILATTFAKALRADLALGDGEIADSCACNIAAASALDDGQAPVVSADACRRIRALLHSYLDSAIERQRTLHRGLVRMRESQEERLFNRGVVHAEAKAKLERHTKALEKLSDSVGLLCEALGLAPPQMEDPASAKDQLGIVFDGPSVPGGDESSKGGQWEDDEERMFYTSLLDLRSKIPPAMLESGHRRQGPPAKDGEAQTAPPSRGQDGAGDTSGDTPIETTPGESDDGDAVLDDFNEGDIEADMSLDPTDLEEADDDDADESLAALGILEYQKFIAQRRGDGEPTDSQDMRDATPANTAAGASPTPQLAGEASHDEPGSAGAATATAQALVEGTLTIVQQTGSANGITHMIAPVSFAQLLRRLPTMTTKDEVDQAAADFCYVNTRTNRKALAAALLDAPRRQMFVIPHYGRFLATLHPFFPDIGEAVVDELSRDFGWLARKRFKGLLDARLKNARYIAELTKFRVAPLHVSFRCARTLLEQFHVQNIEVLCALLDGCGRFLRTQPQTASRVESLLEILIRKRRVLNLDDRTMLLIENTCSACQPHRAREAAPAKFRTPYERYIRKLVYEDLTDGTVDAVCQRLRRLPWGDGTGDDAQRVRHALVCCFAKVWKLRHATIRPAAAALAALRRLHPWFGVSVVDAVVENIKLGLERNTFEHSQRRIAEALYMGEMFRYGAVGANDVLDLVRLFLGFGHREPLPLPGRSCELDPSSSYFRIRLICTLLLACWPRINSVGIQQALAGIAQHLQMYILAKDQPLPVDIDYNVDSLFETVFAGTMRFESWDQAAQVAAMAAQRPMQPTSGTQPAGVDAGQATPCSLPVPASPAQPLASGEIHAARGGAADTSSVREEANSEGCREPGPEDGSISGAGSTESDGNDASAEHAVVDYDAEMYEARRQREALEALIDREEEESLEREFNKLMLESSDVRRAEHTNKLDVGIPMSLMGRSLVLQPAAPAEHAAGGGQAAGDGESGGGSDAIRFSLLTGKKQRPVIHEVDIPAESRMAQSLRQQEELAMREKAHLKRIVLDYERREANEERRLYERELAARRAGAFPGGSGGGGGDGTLAGGSAAARPIVPGATFVSRPSPAASRRRQRVTAVAVQRDQQQQQQRRAGAHPGIPDRFL